MKQPPSRNALAAWRSYRPPCLPCVGITAVGSWPTLKLKHNNRFLRGRKRAVDSIVRHVLPIYGETQHLRRNEYQIKIPYRTDADLDKIMDELLREIAWQADMRNCFAESEALLEGTDRSW
jgi:hypothetical protein